MYEQYWGLRCLPFRTDCDRELYFGSETHEAALRKLRYLVENRLPLGLMLGGPGSGKSFLVGLLAAAVSEKIGPVVHLVFPQLSAAELLSYLAVELGAEGSSLGDGERGVDRAVRQIERQLAVQTARGRRTTIVIDEAHLLDDPRVLQALQLLLNFGERRDIDLSLLLTGDWPLAARVERMGALDERIAVRIVLQPLSGEETSKYVRHRLEAAGARVPIFHAEALQAVFELSGGVPRRINRLCDMALLVAFADQQRTISANDVEAVADELCMLKSAA